MLIQCKYNLYHSFLSNFRHQKQRRALTSLCFPSPWWWEKEMENISLVVWADSLDGGEKSSWSTEELVLEGFCSNFQPFGFCAECNYSSGEVISLPINPLQFMCMFQWNILAHFLKVRLVVQARGPSGSFWGSGIWSQHIGISPPDLAQRDHSGGRNVMQFRSNITAEFSRMEDLVCHVCFVWCIFWLKKMPSCRILL